VTDDPGLSLFDETASAAGHFPSALRGYDRQAVDDYVLSLEAQRSRLREQVARLQQELHEALNRPERRSEDNDFNHLGGYATEMLGAARAQAREITDRAAAEAEEVMEEARRQANFIREQAERDGEDVRMTAMGELRELRTNLERQVGEQVELAREEGDRLVVGAKHHAEALSTQAQRKAQAMLEAARLEAESLRQTAEREAATLRATSATEREELLAKLAAEHEESASASEKLLSDATQNHEEAQKLLETEMENATRIRHESLTEAERVKVHASREADALVTNARKEAAQILQKAEQQAAFRSQELNRENERLARRKQAILAQLNSLSALASQTAADFPDTIPLEQRMELVAQEAEESVALEQDATAIRPLQKKGPKTDEATSPAEDKDAEESVTRNESAEDDPGQEQADPATAPLPVSEQPEDAKQLKEPQGSANKR